MKVHLERISCDELQALRITCGSCRRVFEVTLESLQKQNDPCGQCPFCKASFLLDMRDGTHENILRLLVRALNGLKAAEKQITVEFDIPTEE